jgi:hypothetical protein
MRAWGGGCLLVVVALALGDLVAGPPAAAVHAEGSRKLVPGQYAGTLELRLTSDTVMKPSFPGGARATVEYEGTWKKLGTIDVTVSAPDEATVEVDVDPIHIDYDYTDSFSTPEGDCFWWAFLATDGAFPHLSLGGTSYNGPGSSFDVPLLYAGPTALEIFDLTKAQGSLRGCDQRVSQNLRQSLRTATRKASGLIAHLVVKVGYADKWSMGGPCEVKGWDRAVDIPYGFSRRETVSCSWQTFAVRNRSKKGWK